MNSEEFESRLRSLADPKYREFHSKLIPGTENVLGIRMPELRKLAKEICKGDWQGFLELVPTCYDFTMVRAIVLATAPMGLEERLERLDRFIPEVDNWAVNDTLCCSFKIGRKEDREKLWRYCVELVGRHEEFPSRVGAVMMLNHFIDDEHVDLINDILVSCPRCGYYLDMGVAWTLSFCYIRYPGRTEAAIFDGRLETEVLRMTVRKICDSYRINKEDKERLKKRLKEER